MDQEKTVTPNAKPKKSIVKTWIILPVTFVLVAALGATTGIILKRQFGQTEISYEGFNPESYRMDSKALLKDYEKNKNKNFTAAELINIGLEKYRSCENCYSIGIGIADTIVNQTIRNAQIKVGNHYFEESISYSSMVSVANRVDQVGQDSISLNKGKATASEVASYKNNLTTYEAEEYKKVWGKRLDEMFIYLISNDTVLDEGTKVQKKGEQIKVVVNLEPNISTYYYKIQMKEISSLDKLPSFKYLTHTYIFDNDMTLKYCKVEEQYQASMKVTASIHNTIEYYYHANEAINIPKQDEKIDYSIEGENHYE